MPYHLAIPLKYSSFRVATRLPFVTANMPLYKFLTIRADPVSEMCVRVPGQLLARTEGFEPSERFRSLDFKASALDQSLPSPHVAVYPNSAKRWLQHS